MSKLNVLLPTMLCLGLLSCTTSSWISKKVALDDQKFPQASYDKVLYYHHAIENPNLLSTSSNTPLVDSLWVPKQMVGETIMEFEQYGWQLKGELNKSKVKKLRKIFSDQGRMYHFKPCDPYVFNRCMVFLSEDSTIVGSIYFCPQGYSVEAFPTLRPGISKNFMWSKSGMKEFEKFVGKVEKAYN